MWPPPGGVGPTVPIRSRLRLAQELITALQYNHTDAVTYFTVDKARPTCRVMDTARDIIRHGLPIRCVEAVFLAMYLTAGWKEVERIPLRMRSVVVDDGASSARTRTSCCSSASERSTRQARSETTSSTRLERTRR